ncbi:mechanosensitive ion channel [Thiorhodococcus mannitoliphagus]|uniref:Small-conductance mechanosensitive channel n=1 Tax=Thiorhodococcus mannitoliphagus TaxID=329406 RepID=A0A6P1E346_9GAMM|nr:mechanosensitive ion channel family protein [Thiorhodococcus mannitoliphagus]NEX22444.1 mechanosensitive ion channel [Thiorhodococcus mannitoliphagus]
MAENRLLHALLACSLSVFVGVGSWSFAAEGKPGGAEDAATVADVSVPIEELALLLKPMTKDELLAEAEAWQAVVREKAEEIAHAEIAVVRQNNEIKAAEAIQSQAEAAQAELKKVREKAEEAKASGDATQIQEAEEAAMEARVKVDDLGESVDAAVAAAQKSVEAKETLAANTQASLDGASAAAAQANLALDRVRRAAAEVEPERQASVQKAATEAKQATEEAKQATAEAESKASKAVEIITAGDGPTEAQLETATSAIQAAQDVKKDEKVELLEQLNALREARTLAIDRLKTVLDELESKTDKADSETLAKVQDYRLYIRSVSGIRLNVKDTTSAWVAVKGWFTSAEGGLRWATNIGMFIGILFATWLLSKILSRAMHRALRVLGNASQLLEDFLVSSVRWVVMLVGIIMALAALEVSIGPLLAVVGAAGFVIAFALQDSLSNFASGLMILFFRPFDVGHIVDAGGVSGKVTALNLVSTTIKTFDNKSMLVPNNKIWNDVIINATAARTRRVDMEFGIGYRDDIDRAQALLEEIVAAHPKVLRDPEPTIRMNTLGDSAVSFICRPWASTADYWDVYWDITKAVKQKFDAEGINIPFPQRDVHLYIQDGAKDDETAGALRWLARAPAAGSSKQIPAEDDGDDRSEG